MLATLGFYAGDLRLGFFKIDDPQYVVNNPWIRGMVEIIASQRGN
jgi:hypothetical protein